MIRVRFKSRKVQQTEQYSSHEPYQDNTNPEFFTQEEYPDSFTQEAPEYPQDTATVNLSCNVCGGEITGNCLEVTFKENLFHVHTSCVISAFAIILNGVGFFMDWLSRKKRKNNPY